MVRERTWIDFLMEAPWEPFLLQYYAYGGSYYPETVDIDGEVKTYTFTESATWMTLKSDDGLTGTFIDGNINWNPYSITGESVVLSTANQIQPKVRLSNVRINVKRQSVRYDKSELIYDKQIFDFSAKKYNPLHIDFFKDPIERIHYATTSR